MDTISEAIEADLVSKKAIPKPRFILDVDSDFTIRDTNNPVVAQDLEAKGYGIISYTWGRFQNKIKYEDSPKAPKFDLIDANGLPIRWYLPKLEKAFTMDDVRGVIQKLGMKYVWDWACIPQYWNSTNKKDPKQPSQVIGSLPDQLKTVAAEEVAKQFYIYAKAKKSFIWMHDFEWAGSWNPFSQKTAIQITLENYPSLPQKQKRIEDPTEARPEVKFFVEHYQRIKEDSKWLSSMWALQEGIILNSTNVIDPRDNRDLGIREWNQFARIVDKNGNMYKADTCFRDEATFLDITGRAKFLASAIADYVAKAVEKNQASVAAEHQTWLSLLYETGLVGVLADSPLELLSAAKARSFPTMRDVDYCVNAILGALRIVLPDGTPDGLSDTTLNARRTALLTALVARYSWRMVLLSKPPRGKWNDSFPTDMTAGEGDWIASLLTRTWNFTPLSIFITTQVGRNSPSLDFSPMASMFDGPRPDKKLVSFAQPVPYTQDILLLGAEKAGDRTALPQLRHASAAHAALGLHALDAPDALVVGPEDETARMFGEPSPYGAFFYHVEFVKPKLEGGGGSGGGNGGADVVKVGQGPAWTSCRFYASRSKGPGASGKTSECFLQPVEFANAFLGDTFGADVGVVLLPIENVKVFKPKGTVEGDGEEPEREGEEPQRQMVDLVRCVVLKDFRAGTLRKGSVVNGGPVLVGGGIFLGIGDFTFDGIPQTLPVESVLGKGWMIYMY